MKITASQLRQIIKEELQSTLQESGASSAYTGTPSEWRQGLEAIGDMGYGLSEEQIENLAKNDLGTLDVYNKLINDPHTSLGEMGERIKAAIGVPNWKAHQEYVKTFFDVDIFVDNFWDHKGLKLTPRGTYPSDNNSTNVEYVGDYVDASFNVAQDNKGQVYATILSDPEVTEHRSVKDTVAAVNKKIAEKQWKP